MRFDVRFFTAIVLLLAASAHHALATKTSQTSTLGVNPRPESGGRLLRGSAASPSTEERDFVDPFKKAAMWMKRQHWLDKGKSEEYVVGKLGLKGLSEAAMKDHPNFQFLKKFRHRLEGQMLDDWLTNGVSTQTIWKKFGLEKIPEAQLASNAGYKTWYRYAKMYDHELHRPRVDSRFPAPPLYSDGTPGELNAKVKIWLEKGRSREWVQEMLGIGPNTMANNPHYQKFLAQTNRKY